MYRNGGFSTVEVCGRRARTKNNLRFIEMQRGEPLVILFHRHRRMVPARFLVHPLRLQPPFSFSLLWRRFDRACLFCLAICSE